jgi:siroheme synthase (precorrin-2 oxidase/ferrochelatase)
MENTKQLEELENILSDNLRDAVVLRNQLLNEVKKSLKQEVNDRISMSRKAYEILM